MRARTSINKKEGVPTEDKVEAIFLPIIPDLPTPEIIILPFLQFKIAFTASLNELFIFFLIVLKIVFLFQLPV